MKPLNQNKMKQTAVEWFATELNNWRIKEFGEDAIIGIPQDVFDKAKEMEKEQCLKMLPYDLDELAEKACPDVISSAHSAYKAGFQKALELLTFKSE